MERANVSKALSGPAAGQMRLIVPGVPSWASRPGPYTIVDSNKAVASICGVITVGKALYLLAVDENLAVGTKGIGEGAGWRR